VGKIETAVRRLQSEGSRQSVSVREFKSEGFSQRVRVRGLREVFPPSAAAPHRCPSKDMRIG
jgi:hypothetical protein